MIREKKEKNLLVKAFCHLEERDEGYGGQICQEGSGPISKTQAIEID